MTLRFLPSGLGATMVMPPILCWDGLCLAPSLLNTLTFHQVGGSGKHGLGYALYSSFLGLWLVREGLSSSFEGFLVGKGHYTRPLNLAQRRLASILWRQTGLEICSLLLWESRLALKYFGQGGSSVYCDAVLRHG